MYVCMYQYMYARMYVWCFGGNRDLGECCAHREAEKGPAPRVVQLQEVIRHPLSPHDAQALQNKLLEGENGACNRNDEEVEPDRRPEPALLLF